MANNYVLLQRVELTAAAASVTLSNIPQSGYTDLKVLISTRCSSANTAAAIQFNGDSSGNYSSRRLGGDGTAAYTAAPSSTTYLQWIIIPFTSSTANTFGNAEIYIPDYLSTSKTKCILFDSVSESNSNSKDAANLELNGGIWSKTPEAINSITIVSGGGNLVAGSTFSVYGISTTGTTPTIAPKARGGNTVVTDGTYWYHAFLTSGYFTPLVGLTCDALVIAGGGGGGNNSSGGGGAGGYRGFTSQSLTATNYPIIVGAGGAAATSGSASSVSGTSLTASGGGKGGDANTDGTSGGSGGGAGGKDPNDRVGGSGNAGSYSPVEGYAGGANASTASSNNRATGGGGGAGGVGGNGTTGVSGNGGAGSNTYSSWASVTNTGVSGYFAGGGGGGIGLSGTSAGTGGSGGGANGIKGDNVTGYSATVNTGSGGGGTGTNSSTGGAGGSGIVIIRYAV